MKPQYSTRDTMPAKASCGVVNTGPGTLVVKFGSTKVSVMIAANTASAAPAP